MQRHCRMVNAIVRVHCDDQVIEVDEEQRFLDADAQRWYDANKLKLGQRIVTHNQTAKTVTHIQLKQLKKARMLYALSLANGPRNLCVTHNKIVAHNIAPLVLLTGFCTVVKCASIVTQLYAAYQGRNVPAADNPFQAMFDEKVAAHAMRSVTFGDLVESPVAKNFPKEVLQEYMQKFGATTPLGNLSQSDLSVFAQRVGIEPHLVELMTDPAIIAQVESPIPTQPLSESKADAASTATSTNDVTKPTSSWGKSVMETTRSSLKSGTLNGCIKLGIGLLAGDINSIGEAALTMTKAIGGTVAKNTALTTGTTALVAAGNKVIPEATKKALEYAPVVGTIITVANGVWAVYKLGKGIKDCVHARRKPHLQGPKLQPPVSNNSGNGSGGNGGGGGGRQGDAVGAAGSLAVRIAKKSLSNNKDQVKQAGRIVNKMSKSEFFNLDWVKSSVRHYQGQYYEIIKPLRGVTEKAAKYIRWDYTHGDVEILKTIKGKGDLGSWAPTKETLVWVKKALKDRIIK